MLGNIQANMQCVMMTEAVDKQARISEKKNGRFYSTINSAYQEISTIWCRQHEVVCLLCWFLSYILERPAANLGFGLLQPMSIVTTPNYHCNTMHICGPAAHCQIDYTPIKTPIKNVLLFLSNRMGCVLLIWPLNKPSPLPFPQFPCPSSPFYVPRLT